MSVHAISQVLGFSLNRQTDATTPVVDAKINKIRSFSGQQIPTVVDNVRVSDAGDSGKGDPFATFSLAVQRSVDIPSAQRRASDLDLLFALGNVMGAVSSAQPNPTTMPLLWEHTFVWQPVGDNSEAVYTTLIDQAGNPAADGWKKRITGVVLSQMAINGSVDDLTNLTWQGLAIKMEDVTLPVLGSVTPASFFKPVNATLAFGSNPAPDVSAKMSSFSLNLNRDPNLVWRAGQPISNTGFPLQADVGVQQATFGATLDVDNAQRLLAINDTEVEAVLTLISPDLVNGENKKVTITIPNAKMVEAPNNVNGQRVTNQIAINNDSIIKAPGGQPITIVVTTDIDNSELLVVA